MLVLPRLIKLAFADAIMFNAGLLGVRWAFGISPAQAPVTTPTPSRLVAFLALTARECSDMLVQASEQRRQTWCAFKLCLQLAVTVERLLLITHHAGPLPLQLGQQWERVHAVRGHTPAAELAVGLVRPEKPITNAARAVWEQVRELQNPVS